MNASKRKGSMFEAAVVDFLRENGFPHAERRVMGGTNDRGDIAGVPGVVMELKAERGLNLAAAMTEAEKEATTDKADWWCAIFKRRQKAIRESYVVLTLEQWAAIMVRLQKDW